MPRRPAPRRLVALALLAPLLAYAAISFGCGIIAFHDRPALGYDFGSDTALHIAVIDETSDGAWSPAIDNAMEAYGNATPHIAFQQDASTANIVITVRDYVDSQPPVLPGYLFPTGAGGFAAVYDASDTACNFPPSNLPLNCSGEIASADVYLNDAIPAGADIEARRERLLLHEFGHAMGLTRHSPDLGIAQLAERYGWDGN
jgi:hypothetical protein